MSVHKGKKMMSAISAFNDGTKNSQTAIEKAALTLGRQKRELGEMHFQSILDYTNQIRNMDTIKVADIFQYNPDSTLKDRSLKSFLIYMGVALDKDNAPIYDEYMPIIRKTLVTQSLLAFTNRPLPLVFSSQHCEFRHIQRTGRPLAYDTQDAQWSMMAGLFMAMTLPNVMSEQKKDTLPFALPHEKGLFLGHALACADYNFYPLEFIIAKFSKHNNAATLHGYEPGKHIVTQPDFSPRCFLKILTFVGDTDLHRDQRALQERFQDIFKRPETTRAFNILINTYVSLMRLNEGEAKDILATLDAFENLYKTPEWNRVNSYGQKHLPSRDLN